MPNSEMPKVVILIGPPGAGKSAQAEIMSHVDGWRHISTGQLLRSKRPDLAKKMATGELIDTEDVQNALESAMAEMPPDESIILDGFPRTPEQAAWLDRHITAWGREFGGLVEIRVGDDVAASRLSTRGRLDDNEDVVRRRLELYEEDVAPVVDYYSRRGKLHRVDGVGTVEEVHQRIKEAIG